MSDTQSKSSGSGVSTRKSVENLQNIQIIGKTSHQILGAKLPSNRQLLQVLFYNMRFVDQNKQKYAKSSAKLAIDAAKIFWQQARIPREDHKCVEKLLKLYEDWKSIVKTRPEKRSTNQNEFADSFTNSLDDLFDIASQNAMNEMRIEEDKRFLEMQRKKGRPGCMVGVDNVLYGREKRAQARAEREEERKRKHEEQLSQQNGNAINLMRFNIRI